MNKPSQALDQKGDSVETSKSAIVSLFLGIVCAVKLGILVGIPAVVFGHIAIWQIGNEPKGLKGKGLAIAGLILGYISIALFFATLLLIKETRGSALLPFLNEL